MEKDFSLPASAEFLGKGVHAAVYALSESQVVYLSRRLEVCQFKADQLALWGRWAMTPAELPAGSEAFKEGYRYALVAERLFEVEDPAESGRAVRAYHKSDLARIHEAQLSQRWAGVFPDYNPGNAMRTAGGRVMIIDGFTSSMNPAKPKS